ncbi:hypothetical protein COB64_02685 [Candidatus Wolfebacteria bacterium]|nr:MAG: hypothetical protein COB64_02685 [Candidatus Wolfebacteria bacterium]
MPVYLIIEIGLIILLLIILALLEAKDFFKNRKNKKETPIKPKPVKNPEPSTQGGGIATLAFTIILIFVVCLAFYSATSHQSAQCAETDKYEMYLKDSIAIPVNGSYAIKSIRQKVLLDGSYTTKLIRQKGLLVSPGVEFQFSCPDCVGLFIMKDNRGKKYDYVQGNPYDIGRTIRNPLYTFKFDSNNQNRDKAPMMYLWEQRKI